MEQSKIFPTRNIRRVLVTGGAGFIGSHTVDLLLANGIPVRVLDNFSSGRLANLPASHPLLEIVFADITDGEAVDNAMAGVSHCLHLAAQVSVTASLDAPGGSATQNIVGFVNVAEAARRQGVARLVYASSAAVYGEPASVPLPESAGLSPLSPYGLEKKTDEEYASLYQRIHGLSTMGLRYFNVYGPRQDPASPYAGVISIFAERISHGVGITIYGDGRQTRDFVYVGDVARANLAALEAGESATCNVGTGRQCSLIELVETIAAISGRTPRIEFAAPREGDIEHSLADVSRLRELLGIRAQTRIDTGLRLLHAHGMRVAA